MSAQDHEAPAGATPREVFLVGLAAALVALALLLPGLSELGLWSFGELEVLDRSRAALGEPLRGLERHPWLPDALRTQGLARLGPELGLRLPGCLATTLLVGVAAGLARQRGGSRPIAALAGLFVLAFPGTIAGARTALGNPIGEAAATLVVVVGIAAARPGRRSDHAAALGLLAAGFAAVATAGVGVVLGAAVPLAAIALAHPGEEARRWLRPVLGGLVAALTLVAAWLAWNQGDGFIPLLGASRDLTLVDEPQQRAFSDALGELGFFTFPWLPLAAVGTLAPGRDRWPGLWLLVGLGALLPWTALYGPTPAPLSVPAALACAAGLEHLWNPDRPRAGRRLALLMVLAGLLIMAKDAERTPERVGVPLSQLDRPDRYPAEVIGMDEQSGRLAKLAVLGLGLAFLLTAPSRTEEDEGPVPWTGALRARAATLPRWVRDGAPPVLVAVVLGHQAWVTARVTLPAEAAQLSLKAPFQRWRTLVDAGALPAPLGLYRIRDPGLDRYGPGLDESKNLESRADLFQWMHAGAPAAALIRRSELPPLHARSRAGQHPLFVLDDRHHDLLLVANRLPEGMLDQNPIPTVLLDEAPPLEHETRLVFDDRLALLGWEFEGPVRRGREATMVLAFEVLKPVPGNAQLFARLQMRKLSRINAEPQDFAGRVYPPGNWRPGDIILHRFTFDVSRVEAFPGPHELIVGVRRSERENLPITVPEGKAGEHGVEVRGKKREFARVGEVDVK